MAAHSSETERRADEAERDTEKLKKAEYMSERVGQTFQGVISSMTGWGLYVELDNTIEGLVHVSRMYDDRYYYNEDKHEMAGADTGKTYHLGERIAVRVVGCDLMARTIDFELAEE